MLKINAFLKNHIRSLGIVGIGLMALALVTVGFVVSRQKPDIEYIRKFSELSKKFMQRINCNGSEINTLLSQEFTEKYLDLACYKFNPLFDKNSISTAIIQYPQRLNWSVIKNWNMILKTGGEKVNDVLVDYSSKYKIMYFASYSPDTLTHLMFANLQICNNARDMNIADELRESGDLSGYAQLCSNEFAIANVQY